ASFLRTLRLEARDLILVERNEPADLPQRPREISGLLGNHFKREGWSVVGEQHTVAAVHESTRGRYRQYPEPVLRGQRCVVRMVHYLQVREPGQQPSR